MDVTTAALINSGIAAFSGLTGASIGALVTVAVARSTSARQWNREIFAESRIFYVDMIETVNELHISHGASVGELKATYDEVSKAVRDAGLKIGDRVDFRHDRSPDNRERVASSTAKFRQIMAKAVIFGEEDVNNKLSTLDSAREEVVLALNAGDLGKAQPALEKMGTLLKPLYRTTQRGTTKHSLVALNSFHPFRGKKKARKALLENLALLDKRDKEDQNE